MPTIDRSVAHRLAVQCGAVIDVEGCYVMDEADLAAYTRTIERAARPQWQPIETAPKDGTRILGWCDGYWDICYMQEKYGLGLVWMTDNCADFGGYETPTYWMPLPEAPEVEL